MQTPVQIYILKNIYRFAKVISSDLGNHEAEAEHRVLFCGCINSLQFTQLLLL